MCSARYLAHDRGAIGQSACMSTLLELVSPSPDWLRGLGVALTRPEGVPERRSEEDPWTGPEAIERPRRISDDLAWLRQAMDDPAEHGLKALEDTAAQGIWQLDDPECVGRLVRLRDRGVLDACGFLLHESEPALA
jgi:hypothetical protein